jgi:DtxR family Mn-dependent transcriptional regulator
MSSLIPWIVACVLIILVVGGLTALSRGGPIAWWRRLRDTRRRVLAEDALKHIHHGEWGDEPATVDSLSGHLRLSRRRTLALITQMVAQGWLQTPGDDLRLTPAGKRLALQVIRAHRLWERYLVDEARMRLVDVHAEAERREHDHLPEELDAIDAAMGYPSTDPHGDPIPTADGDLPRVSATPVTDWPLEKPARIVHLEDEPEAVFAQIDALGFRLGQTIRVLEADSKRIIVSDGEETHVLARGVAANIFVGPPVAVGKRRKALPLTTLRQGQHATIDRLDDALQGFTRRRLLDLGLTPGTTITAEMCSLARDPVAYRVRGTLIALRKEQASHVLVDVGGNGGTRHA